MSENTSVESPRLQAAEPSRIQALTNQLNWKYPAEAATTAPAIKRVSQLRQDRALHDGEEQSLFSQPSRQPEIQAGKITAADRGSACHLFLEFLDLEKTQTIALLRQQADGLILNGVLSSAEAEALDLKAILKFWQSPVGQQILASPSAYVQREIPFTARVTPADLASLGLCSRAAELDSEFFIARGKVDLAVISPDEIWVLDFKTDRLSRAEAGPRLEYYMPQLRVYGLALSRIYHRPVTRLWLHWLTLGRTDDLSLAPQA